MTPKEIEMLIEKAVTKIVERKIVSILKQQQQNIMYGTVIDFDTTSRSARVRVLDTTLTLPYSEVYNDVISAGKRCIILTLDPKNRSNKTIISIL